MAAHVWLLNLGFRERRAMAVSHFAAVIVTLFSGVEGARRFRKRSDPGTTIVNGTDAPACKWKWQGGLYQSGGSSPFCGGTIIASNWVVTAAHCVTNSRFDVMGGDILPGRGQRRSAAQVYTRSNADFALVRLSSGFNLDSCFQVPALCSRLRPPSSAPVSAASHGAWIRATFASSANTMECQPRPATETVAAPLCARSMASGPCSAPLRGAGLAMGSPSTQESTMPWTGSGRTPEVR